MVINVDKLSKRFKSHTVIDQVTVKFESGHIYGLWGRNGTGKSVFLKLLCGFYFPTEGEVLFDGVNYSEKKEFPESLRVFIEQPSFFPDMTGFENLKLLADIQKKITDDDINKALDIVCLGDERNKKYGTYSLGMKQKLGIAQVIMENPKIMILDEPFNGIEEQTVKKLIAYLKEEKNQDKLIIISTHIKEDLLMLADVIYQFEQGRVMPYEE